MDLQDGATSTVDFEGGPAPAAHYQHATILESVLAPSFLSRTE